MTRRWMVRGQQRLGEDHPAAAPPPPSPQCLVRSIRTVQPSPDCRDENIDLLLPTRPVQWSLARYGARGSAPQVLQWPPNGLLLNGWRAGVGQTSTALLIVRVFILSWHARDDTQPGLTQQQSAVLLEKLTHDCSNYSVTAETACSIPMPDSSLTDRYFITFKSPSCQEQQTNDSSFCQKDTNYLVNGVN